MGSLDGIQTLISNREDEEVLSIKPKTHVQIAVVSMCPLHLQCYGRIGILGLRSLFAMEVLGKHIVKLFVDAQRSKMYAQIELGKQPCGLAQIYKEILTLDDD